MIPIPRIPRFRILLINSVLLALAFPLAAAPPAVGEELVWPPPPQKAKVTYVQSIQTRRDLGITRWQRFIDFLTGRKPSFIFRKPYGVAADNQGKIFITDTAGALVVVDPDEKKISTLGTSGQGKLTTPIGVAVDENGTVYVSDAEKKRIFGYGPDGELVLAIGREGELKNPAGLAIDRQRKRIYLADSHFHKVLAYDTEGNPLFEIGGRGSGPGQFNFPSNVFVDSKGALYVCDSMNFRVQVFSPEGTFGHAFGELGDGIGQFARPKGIAVDSDGNVYVADAAFDNFQIFDPRGELLLFIGEAGRRPGEFWLPAGIHIDGQDRIYVVDQYNRRVQIFQYLKETIQNQ